MKQAEEPLALFLDSLVTEKQHHEARPEDTTSN